MKKLATLVLLLFSLISNAQKNICDSIMKQMDVEIENAKKNGADINILKHLEQTKETLRNQYCKDYVLYNNGWPNDGSNSNEGSEDAVNENNTPYLKTRAYNGEPFYSKQKISVFINNYGAEGNVSGNYSYYVNKEGNLILLDRQGLQNNLSLVPSFDDWEGRGTFLYWAMRNDGVSTFFGLSDKNEKIAVTTYLKNFLFSPKNAKTPTIKKLNQSKIIAGHLCNAYQITMKDEEGNMTMTWWITTKPLAFHHDIVPFFTMFMADKVGFPNLINHGVLEIEGTYGTESVHLKVTKIEPSTKSVRFDGFKEYFMEY